MNPLLAVTALLLAPQDVPEDHPLCKDATGIRWVLPFAKARARAAEEGRVLMIKPVAFGTTPDGGW